MKRWRSQIRDLVALVRCMTFRRTLNLFTLWITFIIVRYTKRVILPSGPAAISVEPTTHCNLRCPECPSGLGKFSRPTGNIDPGEFEHWLSMVHHQVIWLNLYFQGEPMLYPHFFSLIASAQKHRMYTMTSTNGHFLSEDNCLKLIHSGLHKLIISLDGMDQFTYEQYRRGGHFQTVREGIMQLLRLKTEMRSHTPFLEIQFLVLGTNEHQLEEVRKWMDLPGVDAITFKTAQIYNYRTGSPLIPSTEKYSRYRSKPDGSFELKSKLPDYCWRAWFSSVITWDGLVVPCCYDKDASFALGSLQSDAFPEIWKGEKYQRFRKKLFTNRREIHICTNCGEGYSLQ
jgi:radical SAM protein with 4Fe4S-binding SPASM domain